MLAHIMRTVREEDNVASRLDSQQHSRAAEVWDGLKWILGRHPENGEAINDDFYLMKSADMGDSVIPIITALYTYDANEVQVLDIRISETEED